jgi:hypothetical protein
MSDLHGGNGTDPIGAPDPFDPALLRLSQDPLAAAGVKKALIACRCAGQARRNSSAFMRARGHQMAKKEPHRAYAGHDHRR